MIRLLIDCVKAFREGWLEADRRTKLGIQRAELEAWIRYLEQERQSIED